jgi:stearoyl-CoA desaturase (delta-9 desaturase)
MRTVTEVPAVPPGQPEQKADRLLVGVCLPFIAVHLALGLVFVTGISWTWVLVAAISYLVRMLAVSAGYHRYFSHRAFRTNRLFQFVLAWAAQMSAQRGVLWWASHHRQHHKYADTGLDVHSAARGFWWAHLGWMLSSRHQTTNYDSIKEYSRFPELVWLNEHPLVPSLSGLVLAWYFGGLPGIVWACVVPTVLVWHACFAINSLGHRFGSRRYLTADTSRNNVLLALLTCGDGWHNNHHSAPNAANLGWFWWELDLTFYALKVLSWLGVVRDLRLVRPDAKYAFREYTPEQRQQLREGVIAPVKPPLPTPESSPAIGFDDSGLLKP